MKHNSSHSFDKSIANTDKEHQLSCQNYDEQPDQQDNSTYNEVYVWGGNKFIRILTINR